MRAGLMNRQNQPYFRVHSAQECCRRYPVRFESVHCRWWQVLMKKVETNLELTQAHCQVHRMPCRQELWTELRLTERW